MVPEQESVVPQTCTASISDHCNCRPVTEQRVAQSRRLFTTLRTTYPDTYPPVAQPLHDPSMLSSRTTTFWHVLSSHDPRSETAATSFTYKVRGCPWVFTSACDPAQWIILPKTYPTVLTADPQLAHGNTVRHWGLCTCQAWKWKDWSD